MRSCSKQRSERSLGLSVNGWLMPQIPVVTFA